MLPNIFVPLWFWLVQQDTVLFSMPLTCPAWHSCVPMCLTHATTVFPLGKITGDFDSYNQKQFCFLCLWVWSSQPDTVLTSNSLPLLHQAGHNSVYCLWPIQTDTVHFPAPVQKTTLITILFSIYLAYCQTDTVPFPMFLTHPARYNILVWFHMFYPNPITLNLVLMATELVLPLPCLRLLT